MWLVFFLLFSSIVSGQIGDGPRSSFESDPVRVRAGIILTSGTGLPYDYNVVAPALEAAYERSLVEYNVQFDAVNYLYQGGCSITNAVGQTMLAINDTMDFLIGPACTEDMMMSLELQTFYLMPSVTGGGDLTDSTAKYPYVTRCSYNTYTQWTFFVRMCIKYGWTNVVIINDETDHAKTVNSESLTKNLRNHDLRTYPFSINATDPLFPGQIGNVLKQANQVARVMVFLMNGLLVRAFLIAANGMGFGDGTHLFLALDPFMNDVLGPNGWKQDDAEDAIALMSYKSLFVLTLRDTENEPRYKEFVKSVQDVGARLFPNLNVTSNYYIASFYDSVLLYALSINETLALGHSIGKDNTLELSQKFWNRTYPGASGLVYINPDGDRNDDHSMFNMQPDGTFVAAAEFYGYKDILIPNYYYDQLLPFYFNNPTNSPTENEPVCGYLGDKPICDTTKQKLGVTFGAISAVMLICAGLAFCRIKHVKRTQGLKQLDLLGTWRDVTHIHPRTADTSKKPEDETTKLPNGHGEENVLATMLSVHNLVRYFNTTVEGSFKGHSVVIRLCAASSIVINQQTLAEIRQARSLVNTNILALQGVIAGPGRVALLYSACSKGSLWDLLNSPAAYLDWVFRFSVICDLVSGLEAIHNSALAHHGRLTSHCVFMDSRFEAKIADYGLPSFFARPTPANPDSAFSALLLWTAPELLIESLFRGGTQEGDVYSLAIVCSQIIMREKPFGRCGLDPAIIVARVQKKSGRIFRPKIDANLCPPEMVVLLQQCWAKNALERPRIAQIKSVLKQLERNNSERGNVLNILIKRMENYTSDLERSVEEKTFQCLVEKDKTERLLYDILPRSVADQLKCGVPVAPESFDSVSIQYSDIVNFTILSSYSTAQEVVDLLNSLYSIFDRTIAKFNTYKVETIGDCYVVASGIPIRNGDQHAAEVCRLALAFLTEVKVFKIVHRPKEQLRLRFGVHTGSCVSGVVGTAMPHYCLFGETVTIAAKMEATSDPMRIQLTQDSVEVLQRTGNFRTEKRTGLIKISDHLSISTYWLLGERAGDSISAPA